MKGDKVAGKCGEEEECVKYLGGKTEGKTKVSIPNSRWKNNVKKNIQEIEMEDMDRQVWLRACTAERICKYARCVKCTSRIHDKHYLMKLEVILFCTSHFDNIQGGSNMTGTICV